MMLGGPEHEPSLLFSGSVTATGPQVLYAQEVIPVFPRPLDRGPTITPEALDVAAEIGAGIEAIQDRRMHDRLKRGFWTWVGAIREQHLHARLHQFVRSIDALIGSESGKGKVQFVSRGQMFAEGRDVELILSQLYQLRSVEEHFRPWQPILNVAPGNDAERIGALRAYQAERLASHVYAITLANSPLLEHFRDEETIAKFWSLDESVRCDQWPLRLDLAATETEHQWRPELLREQ